MFLYFPQSVCVSYFMLFMNNCGSFSNVSQIFVRFKDLTYFLIKNVSQNEFIFKVEMNEFK